MRSAPALAALALLLAGCATPAAVEPASGELPPAQAVQVTDDRPEPTFNEVATGPAAAADPEATLDRAPQLQRGEWWRIKFRSPFDGMEAEFVRVIADVQDGNYVVGMPHEGWFKEAVVYHSPAFGDVNGDLSYDTHDLLFTPVKFPLTAEQTWETEFSGGPPMVASVEVLDSQTAKVTFTATVNSGPFGTGPPQEQVLLELEYDARIHEVRRFTHAIVEWEVLEHGYNFTGWTTIPRGEDLVFIHGRFTPALGIGQSGQGPSPPLETVEVAGGYNRVTFIQLVGSVLGAPGAYRTVARAPDGTEYVTESVPGQDFVVQFFENNAPDGTWELEHVAAGPGITFIEGIAYHQYDIHLPSGGKRADHSHDVIR